MQACEEADVEGQRQLQALTSQAAALRCAAHAEAVAGEANEAEGVRQGVGSMQLGGIASASQSTGELVVRLTYSLSRFLCHH